MQVIQRRLAWLLTVQRKGDRHKTVVHAWPKQRLKNAVKNVTLSATLISHMAAGAHILISRMPFWLMVLSGATGADEDLR